MTVAQGTYTGCTIGSINNVNAATAALATDTFRAIITMTGPECQGYMTFEVMVAAGAVYDWRVYVPINIQVEQPNMFYQCGANGLTENTFTPATSQCLNPQTDNWNHLCSAGALGSCTTATINTVVSGSLTVSLSGTVAVVNSGSQSISISGVLTIHQDPLSGAVTVTNAGGQTLTVHQDPISGALTVHQDPICTAAAHCHIDSNSTLIGNSTTVFPGNLTVDLKSKGGLSSVGGPGFQWWTELVFWVLVFAFCWYFRSYYILVFAIGGVFHLINPAWVFGLDKSLPLIGLGFLLEWFVSVNRRRNGRLEPKGKGLSEAT